MVTGFGVDSFGFSLSLFLSGLGSSFFARSLRQCPSLTTRFFGVVASLTSVKVSTTGFDFRRTHAFFCMSISRDVFL
jgi:hypothetical protein